MTNSNEKPDSARRNALKKTALVGSAAALWALGQARAGAAPVAAVAIKCLLRGTAIETAEGPRAIENLAVGDLLPTMFGGLQPIQWIGRFPVRKSNPSRPWPKMARPVRIARSALAPNVPAADLYVSQAHGLLLDDVIVPAGCLVNGTTITLGAADASDTLEFYHVKLEKHDVIIAEGAPVETLLEVDESAVNFAEYFRAYGMPSEPPLPCRTVLDDGTRAGGLKSRIRRTVSWSERRRIRAIRDRLAQRGLLLAPQAELSV